MKEIEIKTELVSKRYQAFDGTIFENFDECKKYENSAYGVIGSKLMECVINENTEFSEFDINDENVYHTIVPKTEQHIDLINQIYYMFGGRNKSNTFCTIEDIDTPILWGFRTCEYNIDWAWFYKLNNFIESVTNNNYKINRNPITDEKN